MKHMKYVPRCSKMLMFDSESGHWLWCHAMPFWQGKIDEIRRADQHIGNNTAPFVQASGLPNQFSTSVTPIPLIHMIRIYSKHVDFVWFCDMSYSSRTRTQRRAMWIATPGSSQSPGVGPSNPSSALASILGQGFLQLSMAGAKAYPVHGGILADKIGYGKTAWC